MTQGGHNRQPAAIHRLRGNLRADRVKTPPQPPPMRRRCPSWLDDDGRALWRYLTTRDAKADARLFVSTRGGPMLRNSLTQILQRIGERAGVMPANAHRFRHTFAINFLRNGGDVLTLQMLLGHESLAMVRNYVKLASADLDRAARHSPADGWEL